MKTKERIKEIKNNLLYKTLLVSFMSLMINCAFIIYNAYLGIKFKDAFAIGISIYYFLLIWIKSITLMVEKKIAKKEEKIIKNARIKNYKVSSVFVFIIDFCLIAPIILMVTQPKEIKYDLIPAIAMAAYSTYKITLAIINYVKSKKSQNLTIILLREINIIGAIVSILTLQHTLIMVNGGMDDKMRTLSMITSIGFIVLIIIFSIMSFLRNKKLFNANA